MSDTPRLFPLSDQPAPIQLIVSAIIILFIGLVFIIIFILAGSLFSGIGINEMLSAGENNIGADNILIFKYLQAIQGISLFILPSLVISFLMTNGRGNWLTMKNIPSVKKAFLVICLAVLLIPLTSATGIINSKMVLPSWLNGLESWIKEKENNADNLTGILLEAKDIWALVINVIVLAVLTAIGEEFLFRGVLQQIFQKMFKSGTRAIWVTAIVFSFIHLQFYGFLPRLLLGLVFGYLFYWGRSIWLPVIAHFVNNAIPVISSYFEGWNQSAISTPEFAGPNIIYIFLSVLGCTVILLYFRHEFSEKKNVIINGKKKY
jgi:membrane protease YdiL (CAAX protease family)